MKLRIDLKIIIFIIIFYFTKQLKIYLMIMSFCFLHELGHITMALILKMKIRKLEIMPCGFAASFKSNDQVKECEKKKIIIAFAGPIFSLILAILFTCIDVPDMWKDKFVYSNILILIFNLLPLYPLDGGRIINGILYYKMGEEKARYITDKISNITIIILTIISSIAVYYFKNIAIFLICISLWQIVLNKNFKQYIKYNDFRRKKDKSLDIL